MCWRVVVSEQQFYNELLKYLGFRKQAAEVKQTAICAEADVYTAYQYVPCLTQDHAEVQ